MKGNHLIILAAALMLHSCSTVPVTGRKQLKLLPNAQMQSMSASEYDNFLSQNTPLPDSDPQAQNIKKIGADIAAATEKYLNENGYEGLVDDFDWTFNLVDDQTLNAWCMPGGRVVFYTGILPVCKNNNGIAAVMGHEVAHAVARHGNERMSQQLAIQGAGMSLSTVLQEQPELTHDLALQAFGMGSQFGVLGYSRKHESEADKMGLVFMAIAGYDPREAVKVWERMAELGGEQPPEFMSTHPSHETRIDELNAFMDEAMKYYQPNN
ncbi:MAG: putative Zn-dependent protease [Cryomorphaceae bacterium]|jgi:predicted Zn-dependent protease